MKKLFSILALLAFTVGMHAGNEWMLITDDARQVPMSNVAALLAADDASTFSIVLNEGETIQDVKSCTFEFTNGISTVTGKQGDGRPIIANGRITLSNVAPGAAVSIYTINGMKVMDANAAGSIDISQLKAGAYVLNIGRTAVKFIKK